MKFISTKSHDGQKLEFEMDFDAASISDVEFQPDNFIAFKYWLSTSFRTHGLQNFEALNILFIGQMGYNALDLGAILDFDDENALPKEYLPYATDDMIEFDVVASDRETIQTLLELLRQTSEE